MPASPLEGLSVLVLDDEPLWRQHVAAALERFGADVTGVGSLAAARQMAGELSFDFAIVDVRVPDGLGTDLLKDRTFGLSTPVIVMTGNAEVSGVVSALRLGAADYLVKPFDPSELLLVLGRVRRSRQTARVEEHRRDRDDAHVLTEVFAPVRAQLDRILADERRASAAPPPVLLQGETGSGTTTIARWLHRHGSRAAQALVEVHGPALTEPLAERELLGHERGAFPEATASRMGLIEAANGGTLFVDEPAALPPGAQARLFTALEEGRIRRVGARREVPVDVRLIAATRRDLDGEAAAGRFHSGLLRRFDVCRVVIPPLRERGAELAKLAALLVERICQRRRLAVRPITEEGQRRLLAHRWPGNIRELAHTLERAIVFEESPLLDFPNLVASTAEPGVTAKPGPDGDWLNPAFRFPAGGGFDLEDAINRLVLMALKATKQNVTAAARLLGVTRDYVRYRIEEKGLSRELEPKTPTAGSRKSEADE